MPSGGPPVGFDIMVAPVNGFAKTKDKGFVGSPTFRSLQQLLGGGHATSSLGLGLLDCIRTLLQRQKVQVSNIDAYLENLGSV